MPDINPEQLKEWIEVAWEVGWRGGLILAVVYYRQLVIHFGEAVIDILASWLKRK